MLLRRLRAHITPILLALCLAGSAYAVERLDIYSTADTSYLPMRYAEIFSSAAPDYYVHILRRAYILDDHPDSLGRQRLVILRNSAPNTGEPAIVTQKEYPTGRVIDDDAIRLTLVDSRIYEDPIANQKALILVGYAEDSAWILKHIPGSGTLTRRLLATGANRTGEGIWDPTIHFCLMDDYDYDGRLEAFIYLTSRRNHGPRTLFCIQLDTFDEEWRLPVASQMQSGDILICHDSLDPKVIFTTGNPMQGRTDNNYNDRFGYVSIVDSHGHLRYNRIVSVAPSARFLIPAIQPGQFYLVHHTPLLLPDSVLALADSGDLAPLVDIPRRISRIDSDGNVLDSAILDYWPHRGWVGTFGPERQPSLYLYDNNQVVHALDSGLNLIAESEPVVIRDYLGCMRLATYDSVLVFSDGIFSRDLQKLVHFPIEINHFEPLTYHEDSSVATVLISNGRGFTVGKLETRSIVDLASVFYHRNQNYFLMVLSGLIVGLIMVNIYRRRARHAADLIARQKEELQQTHTALKNAQAKIIEQEKYQQARDIAGGFSHEIRNALFPAVGLLAKAKTVKLDSETNVERVRQLQRDAAKAVSRAVGITEMISQYTRLGSQHLPEKVNVTEVLEDVIDANRYLIDRQSTEVRITGISDLTVVSNFKQLAIVLNNLLLNSLDALAETPHPTISVTTENSGNHVRLCFSDNGSGIPEENRARIFDTFFSTKPDRGMGIGLSTVRKIIEMYDGTISVHDSPDGGTTFELLLLTNAS